VGEDGDDVSAFHDAAERLIKGAMVGLYQAGLDIMYVSQIECPVDTATLKSSARVNEPVRSPVAINVELGYGYGEQRNPVTGETASQYAIPVHERMGVKHKPPTKAKYLEDPALAYEVLYGRTLAMWITRAEKTTRGLDVFTEPLMVSHEAQAMMQPGAGDERRASLLATSAGIGSARSIGLFLRGGV